MSQSYTKTHKDAMYLYDENTILWIKNTGFI